MKNFNSNNLVNLATKILFLGFLGTGVVPIKTSLAQSNITPDNTLGRGPSRVTPNVNNPDGIPSELIEGGTQQGQNLFHSFGEFDVDRGRGAYFLVPNDTIQNVLTRVTGNKASSINGILGTISNRNFNPSNVNLFLINPNGIMFGENGSLDVNGSFVGTTANALEFGERGLFSATNPQAPSELLTVNPSAFLFSQINTQASIKNNSIADVGLNQSDDFTPKGLRVGDGKSLLLVGGDINIDSGGLVALGGKVELGGLADEGTVGLNVGRNNLSLTFPDDVTKSNIFLSNNAAVTTLANNGGSIAVNAQNLEIIDKSGLFAGIDSSLGSDTSKAGNINLNVTEAINLKSESQINNQVRSQARGQAGDINISANTLRLEDGSFISASTRGQGAAGNLTIDATDVKLIGRGKEGELGDSGLFTNVNSDSIGNAGEIDIVADSLEVEDKAVIDTSTQGNGNAGAITITAKDIVSFNNDSYIFSRVNGNAQGNAGEIRITTGILNVTNGGQINSDTFGQGYGGNIIIHAEDSVNMSGEGDYRSGLYSNNASYNAQGNAGDVQIATGSLKVDNKAVIDASTRGEGDTGKVDITARDMISFNNDSYIFSRVTGSAQGNANDINITTGSLSLTNGSQINSDAFGQGDGANIIINARDSIKISGKRDFISRLSSEKGFDYRDGKGDAGNIIIFTGGSLEVSDRAEIRASTEGKGNSGEINITAKDTVSFRNNSYVFSRVNGRAQGNAGDIRVNTGSLNLSNGGQINSDTFGQGDGGNIIINARDSVNISGVGDYPSGLYSNNASDNAMGDSGDLIIETNILRLEDGGRISAASDGTGIAGDINVNVKDNFNADNGQVFTQSVRSSGGNIDITAGKNIILRNDSNIRTTLSKTAGSGGNITLTANTILALEDSDILAFAPEGRGGDITFNTNAFLSDSLFSPAPQIANPPTEEELNQLDGNNRVDVNATGSISSGNIIGLTDPSFLQDDLTELPENLIDSQALVASSCVVRSKERNGTFFIATQQGLPYRPGDAIPSRYSAVKVQSLVEDRSATKPNPQWKIGDPIMEPTGVYRLGNGRLILSRECGK